ncbi:Golgi matrix protein [Aspergillus bombycis]|uniref:Golgi matrix protein n=1 Tax=Aspergillus bombycis TaxID=109264 RepID=A0A1F7ZXL8_9EURO|nr:Golgi matrix protein [Aspergillus bombycis]OGM43788.1 Golgi matrix protein [Aspergillus bombycis]
MPEDSNPRNKRKNKGSVKNGEGNDKNIEEQQDVSAKLWGEGSPDLLNSSVVVPNSTEETVTEKQKAPMSEDRSASHDDLKNDYSDQLQAVSRYGEKEDFRRVTKTPPDALQSKERFDALVRDRDSLRAEVTDMRRSLEEIQSKHRADMEALQHKLNDAEGKKEHAESQFQKLLERVNTIKSQLGERLKEDAEELAQARLKIGELEEQNSALKENFQLKCSELTELSEANEHKSKEISTLRDRMNLSQQNWLKEKEELLEQQSYLQSEFEQAKEAMHNWEVLAMEERSIRETLGEKVVDLEEQLASLKDAYERTSDERDSQLAAVDGLQRALQEIQTARRKELRELVENSDAQLEELKQALHCAEKKALDADKALRSAQKELERVRPHIVTNHFLHFLTLDRSDPKKFQILQLIAALLGWTDEQREQAGLARPGTSGTSNKLRVPSTPIHRTPSTPTLATEFLDNGNSNKESLAELWSNFLEQESQTAQEYTQPKP